MAKPVKFLSNHNLLEQIWLSKLTYCDIYDARYTKPDIAVGALSEINDPDITVQLITTEHIPAATVTRRGKFGGLEGVTFQPFKLFRSELIKGEVRFREVARSHWKDGQFEPKGGCLTPKLGEMLFKMVERYSMKGNWRSYSYLEEMKGEALLNLCDYVLKFDETKSRNPFAYITTSMSHSFTRCLNAEKKQASIRDDLLEDAGMAPSIGRQLAT